MPLGQGWLNAWVKVNNKHVVYNRNDKEGDEAQNSTQTVTRNGNKSSTTTNSDSTAQTTASEGAETQAIRRVNSRKNKRRLHRTISASDLIRDKAKDLGGKPDGGAVLDVSTSSQTTVGRTGGSSSLKRPPVSRISAKEESVETSARSETEGSLRFMAGFLGTDIESLSLEPKRGGDHDGWSIDAASLEWVSTANRLDAASIPSRGGKSLPTRTSNGSYRRINADDTAARGGFRFPGFSNDDGQCRQCAKLGNELAVIEEDLEYLRALALRNEFICTSCQAAPTQPAVSAPHVDLNKSDRLLEEVTARHKVQLEQLTKDRQRWQHDAQVKLQKYAGLCRDLNDEASLRNDEVISLRKEMDTLRSERDRIAAELEVARAIIVDHERDAEERGKMEIKIQQYENRGLDEAEAAIKTRDAIIADLSGRLEKSLDLLEYEREQQRQRRQIIFPSQRCSLTNDQQDVANELKATKEVLLSAQSELHALRLSVQRREAEMNSRIEALQRQLNTQ